MTSFFATLERRGCADAVLAELSESLSSIEGESKDPGMRASFPAYGATVDNLNNEKEMLKTIQDGGSEASEDLLNIMAEQEAVVTAYESNYFWDPFDNKYVDRRDVYNPSVTWPMIRCIRKFGTTS